MIGRVSVALALLLMFCIPAVRAEESQILLDFDQDNDPNTIQTELLLAQGQDTAVVRLILHVGDSVPNGAEVHALFREGCCDLADVGHFATGNWSIILDDTYFPPCGQIPPPLCPFWREIGDQFHRQCEFNDDSGFDCNFCNSLPVVPGKSDYIGEAIWKIYCDTPCNAPTSFTYAFTGVAGSGTMTFHCPPPTPTENTTWGMIKTGYR